MEIDDRILVSKVLETLQIARQVAYDCALEMPDLREAYESAEANYAATAQKFGAAYRPVFDRRAHIEERIAKGDRDHTFARDSGFYNPVP